MAITRYTGVVLPGVGQGDVRVEVVAVTRYTGVVLPGVGQGDVGVEVVAVTRYTYGLCCLGLGRCRS